MKIINYSSAYYDKLCDFVKKHFPNSRIEYLDYRLSKIPYNREQTKINLLVVNDQDDIVGMELFFPTKALISGVEYDVYWGHDLILDSQYRGCGLGKELMIKVSLIKNKFGLGLSDISARIQNKIGVNFISVMSSYIWITPEIWRVPLYKTSFLSYPKKVIKFPTQVTFKCYNFALITSLNDIAIPNSGYWFKGKLDVEFIRDEHFLQNRFIDNFNQYYLYALNRGDMTLAYFCVRVVVINKLPRLVVVDYRYNANDDSLLQIILRVVFNLGRVMHFPLIMIETNQDIKKYCSSPFIFQRGKGRLFTANSTWGKSASSLKSIVTLADSDADFLY